QPGSLVQNASTGQQAAPLLTLVRSDIVTVVMRVPDNAAPYVRPGTEAIIRIDELPGVLIKARVTRREPSIQNRDRRMRVEVDLFNGSRRRLATLTARCVSTWLAPLAAAGLDPVAGFTASSFRVASRAAWVTDARSVDDPFPLVFNKTDLFGLVG